MILVLAKEGALIGKFATQEDADKVVKEGNVVIDFTNPEQVETLTAAQLIALHNSVSVEDKQVKKFESKQHAVTSTKEAVEAYNQTPAKGKKQREDAFRRAGEELKAATEGTKVAKAIDFILAHMLANNGEGPTLKEIGDECGWTESLARGYLVENVWWLGYGVQQKGDRWTLSFPEGVTEKPAHAARTRAAGTKKEAAATEGATSTEGAQVSEGANATEGAAAATEGAAATETKAADEAAAV